MKELSEGYLQKEANSILDREKAMDDLVKSNNKLSTELSNANTRVTSLIAGTNHNELIKSLKDQNILFSTERKQYLQKIEDLQGQLGKKASEASKTIASITNERNEYKERFRNMMNTVVFLMVQFIRDSGRNKDFDCDTINRSLDSINHFEKITIATSIWVQVPTMNNVGVQDNN